MVVEPSWRALLAHLFLGLVVGLIVQLSRPFPGLGPILPTLSAVVVTLLGTWFVADVAHDGLLPIITPALIATLPGMALVIGAIELASGKIISGSSRVIYGIAQLGLLVYGVFIGVRIAGQVTPQDPSTPMGSWSTYAAVAVIAVGLYLYLSAPRGSLVWLALVIPSVAETVTLKVPVAVGVPVIAPVAPLSESPAGRPVAENASVAPAGAWLVRGSDTASPV
jgi:hypothetical protein